MKQEYRADLAQIRFLYAKGMLSATTTVLMYLELKLKIGWKMRYIPKILSEELGIPVKAIYKAIKRLTTDDWIVITPNRLGDLLIERGPTSCLHEQSEADPLTEEELETTREGPESHEEDNSHQNATRVTKTRHESPKRDTSHQNATTVADVRHQSPERDPQSPKCENRSPEAAQEADYSVPSTFSLLSSYFSSKTAEKEKEKEEDHKQFEQVRKEIWELLERRNQEWKTQQTKRGIQRQGTIKDMELLQELSSGNDEKSKQKPSMARISIEDWPIQPQEDQ